MKPNNEQEQPIKVLAVLVLYGRTAYEAASWRALNAMMGQESALVLKHCVIHDNSQESVQDTAANLPEGFELRLSRRNVGTAGAYVEAINVAKAYECEWLLLLDQDTLLPPDYMTRAAASMGRADVLVPRVWHGNQLISPGVLTKIGSIRPTPILPKHGMGHATAISSGILVRLAAIEESLPFPEDLWLDYVDHWMFLSFERNGFKIGEIAVDLKHNLSIKQPAMLPVDRLESILRAEAVLYQHLGLSARLVLPFRRIMRSFRFLACGQVNLATKTFRHCISSLIAR